MDLPSGRVVDGDLIDRRPEQKLLGFHPLELLDAVLLDVAIDLGCIAYEFAHHLEAVLHLLLLDNPHVAGAIYEAHLDHVSEREKAQREAELLEEVEGQVHALLVALLDDASLLLGHGLDDKQKQVFELEGRLNVEVL